MPRRRRGRGRPRAGGGRGLGREGELARAASRSSGDVGGDDGEAAAAAWARRAARRRAMAVGVERDGGLVEEPEAAGGDEEAGEAEAALLAGGAEVRRAVGEGPEVEGGERGGGVAAEEAGPEGEVLGDGELRLDGVEVAGVGDRLGPGVAAGRAAVELDRGRRRAGGRRARAAASTCRRRSGRAGGASRPGRARSSGRARMRRPPRVQERSVTVRPMASRIADRARRGKGALAGRRPMRIEFVRLFPGGSAFRAVLTCAGAASQIPRVRRRKARVGRQQTRACPRGKARQDVSLREGCNHANL